MFSKFAIGSQGRGEVTCFPFLSIPFHHRKRWCKRQTITPTIPWLELHSRLVFGDRKEETKYFESTMRLNGSQYYLSQWDLHLIRGKIGLLSGRVISRLLYTKECLMSECKNHPKTVFFVVVHGHENKFIKNNRFNAIRGLIFSLQLRL